MRNIRNYTPKEWLRLNPPIGFFKEKRNDSVSRSYVEKRPEQLAPFLERNAKLRGNSIVIIVAFNSPWVIEILLDALHQFVSDAVPVIFDNSNDPQLQTEIEQVCHHKDSPYLSLPPNPEKHPCRSHGIALNWIFSNVIQNLAPARYACIDHDLIPFRSVSITEKLAEQPVYGLQKISPWGWNLWAGYCMHDFQAVRDRPLNFNNDQPNRLDTGGRNWHVVYKKLPQESLQFATQTQARITLPGHPETQTAAVLDEAWLHLAGVGQRKSRKDSFSPRAAFYADVFDQVKQGKPLADFITPLDS